MSEIDWHLCEVSESNWIFPSFTSYFINECIAITKLYLDNCKNSYTDKQIKSKTHSWNKSLFETLLSDINIIINNNINIIDIQNLNVISKNKFENLYLNMIFNNNIKQWMLNIFYCDNIKKESINNIDYVPLDLLYTSYLLYSQINNSAGFKIKSLDNRAKAIYQIVCKSLKEPNLLYPTQIKKNLYQNNKLLNIYMNIVDNVCYIYLYIFMC